MESFLKSPVVIDNVPIYASRVAGSWRLAFVARKKNLLFFPQCKSYLRQSGKAEVSSCNPQYHEPTLDLYWWIIKLKQARIIQAEASSLAWSYITLGRYVASLETCLLSSQDSTKLMPCFAYLAQYESHQTQKKNAWNLFWEVPSSCSVCCCSRSSLIVLLNSWRFATGKATGIVLDSGDGVTHVIPIYEGYSLAHSCERMDLAGRDVTAHLQNLLRKSGINLTTTA